MKALVMSRPGDVRLTEIDRPKIADDQVLIRVMVAGICTNDVRDYQGDCAYSYPRIGGHEYAGVIAEMGDAVNKKRFKLGQRVVNYIIDDCKECYYCKTGNENICEDFLTSHIFQNPDGISGYCGFAEYVVADAKDIVIYEDQTDWERMAFTEPLACVVNSVNRANISFGQDVLVVGGGTMGMLHVILCQLRGARVFLSEPLAERRDKAVSLGAADAFDPTACDPVERIRSLTGGRGADVVFNTVAWTAVDDAEDHKDEACQLNRALPAAIARCLKALGAARWQKLRWSVLVRDLFACQMCKCVEADTSKLVADHRTPHRGDEALFWDASNLQCLCKDCHDRLKQAEERGRRW